MIGDGYWGFRVLIITVAFSVWLISGMPKTWFGLTKKEKKKRSPLIIAGLALVTIGLAVFFMLEKR